MCSSLRAGRIMFAIALTTLFAHSEEKSQVGQVVTSLPYGYRGWSTNLSVSSIPEFLASRERQTEPVTFWSKMEFVSRHEDGVRHQVGQFRWPLWKSSKVVSYGPWIDWTHPAVAQDGFGIEAVLGFGGCIIIQPKIW